MDRYGVKFKWQDNLVGCISGDKSKEPGIQFFQDFYVEYSNVEEFIKYFRNIIGSEYFFIPQWEGVNIFEDDGDCYYCGKKGDNIRLYSHGDRTVCDKCISKTIKKIKSVFEEVLFYDESGVLVKRIGEKDSPILKVYRGDMVIALGRTYYGDGLLFCNGINFESLMDTIKNELNNISDYNMSDYGERSCFSCFEKIEDKSARLNLKEDNMEGVKTQASPFFHEDCMRDILESLEEFSEKYSQELVAKNL